MMNVHLPLSEMNAKTTYMYVTKVNFINLVKPDILKNNPKYIYIFKWKSLLGW